jgi:hypothetical protein
MKYLEASHCILYREGAKHSIVRNILNNKVSSIPRHLEIDNYLARKICRDLDISEIKKK